MVPWVARLNAVHRVHAVARRAVLAPGTGRSGGCRMVVEENEKPTPVTANKNKQCAVRDIMQGARGEILVTMTMHDYPHPRGQPDHSARPQHKTRTPLHL